MADEKKNLRAMTGLLVNGKHVAEGEVIAKSDFANKGDWQNLVFSFNPPRMTETDDKVGVPEVQSKTKLPGQ
jgi:hypothetical protein